MFPIFVIAGKPALHIEMKVFAFILNRKSGQFLNSRISSYVHHLVWRIVPLGTISHTMVWSIVYLSLGLSRASDSIGKCSTLSLYSYYPLERGGGKATKTMEYIDILEFSLSDFPIFDSGGMNVVHFEYIKMIIKDEDNIQRTVFYSPGKDSTETVLSDLDNMVQFISRDKTIDQIQAGDRVRVDVRKPLDGTCSVVLRKK